MNDMRDLRDMSDRGYRFEIFAELGGMHGNEINIAAYDNDAYLWLTRYEARALAAALLVAADSLPEAS